MDNRSVMPLTLAQMGLCSPPLSSRKGSTKKYSVNSRRTSSIKPIPLNLGGNDSIQLSRSKKPFRPSIIREEDLMCDEAVSAKPLQMPKTLAELFAKSGKDVRKSPIYSARKPLPFQNVNASLKRSATKQVGPKNFRNSITGRRLSSITKVNVHAGMKDSCEDAKYSSRRKLQLEKFSESKKSATKKVTEDVASTLIPRFSRYNQGQGKMNVKKALCFSVAPADTSKQGDDNVETVQDNNLDEITGIIRMRQSMDLKAKESDTPRPQLSKRKSQREICDSTDDVIHSDVVSNGPVSKSHINDVDNLLPVSIGQTAKRQIFEKLLEDDYSILFENCLAPNMTAAADDSFAGHELECRDAVSKFICPIGISTPFRQYRIVNDSLEQSLVSNSSINRVPPDCTIGGEPPEDNKNESAFDTLCQMMEGTKLHAMRPKCLKDLNAVKLSIINEIRSLEKDMSSLPKRIEIKKNALQHIESAIEALSDADNNTVQEPRNKTVVFKQIDSTRLGVDKKNVVQSKPFNSTAALQKTLSLPNVIVKTHKMDLRKRVLCNMLAPQPDENAPSTADDPVSKKMYLNIKKNMTFLKTPNGVKKMNVLSEHNHSPSTIVSSNLQKQLHILYDQEIY